MVDDGSADATPRLLRDLEAEVPFLKTLIAPQPVAKRQNDRLAQAAEVRAFNLALSTVDVSAFTHVGKLDADIELPAAYFERLLAQFDQQPRLGVAGGVLLEPGRNGWHRTSVPSYHVRGALKLYSRRCLEDIGGVEERLGWDTIDETYARMRGYDTRSIEGLIAKHHRPVATADGTLRGRARHGQCAYVVRYGPGWVMLRSLKVACSKPRGISGLAFLYGYLRSMVRRDDRVEDERFRRFVARELQARVRLSTMGFLRRSPGRREDAQVTPFSVRS
jgi:biofilm PGA synthesis N-glycosyltransferase PgaC